jgi:hypothetical protein
MAHSQKFPPQLCRLFRATCHTEFREEKHAARFLGTGPRFLVFRIPVQVGENSKTVRKKCRLSAIQTF